ncbi:hypothetical protein EPO15_04720 [bacterium]|nr:MAG: hypothetical protein EPO15_04720 [bacterium]
MTDAEEEALKVRYRAFTRRLGAGLGLAGLYGVFLLSAVQATFVKGFRPVYLWGPVAFATALGLAFFAKRRWVLAALSAAFIGVHLRVLPRAAQVASEAPPRGSRAASPTAP